MGEIEKIKESKPEHFLGPIEKEESFETKIKEKIIDDVKKHQPVLILAPPLSGKSTLIEQLKEEVENHSLLNVDTLMPIKKFEDFKLVTKEKTIEYLRIKENIKLEAEIKKIDFENKKYFNEINKILKKDNEYLVLFIDSLISPHPSKEEEEKRTEYLVGLAKYSNIDVVSANSSIIDKESEEMVNKNTTEFKKYFMNGIISLEETKEMIEKRVKNRIKINDSAIKQIFNLAGGKMVIINQFLRNAINSKKEKYTNKDILKSLINVKDFSFDYFGKYFSPRIEKNYLKKEDIILLDEIKEKELDISKENRKKLKKLINCGFIIENEEEKKFEVFKSSIFREWLSDILNVIKEDEEDEE